MAKDNWGDVVGGAMPILGMMGDMYNNMNQLNENKNFQNRQYGLNNKMADENQRRAKDMIDYMGPKMMLQKYKEAGLNAGHIVGKGGIGGQTMSSAGAGEGSGVGMPNYTPSQQGSTTAMNNIANLALMNAQTKNIEADTKQKEANVPNIGADTENKQANTALTNLQIENQKVLNNITKETAETTIDTIKANYNKAEGEASTAVSQGKYSEETVKAQLAKIQADTTASIMSAEAMKAGIKLTEEQTRAIAQELAQGWEELYQKGRGNDNQAGMVNIAGFKAKADYAIDKANVDLRAKELMIRGAEAFIGGLKGGKTQKGSTTETYKDKDGTITSQKTNHY